ncbi:MAG: AI-2E family transporter [Gemmatimonadaceae bacterium]
MNGSVEGRRRLARLLIAALAAAVLVAIAPYIPGLIGAVVLHVVFRPVHQRLAARMGPRMAAIMLAVGAVALLLLPAAWLMVVAIEQAPGALARMLTGDAFDRLATLDAGPVDVGAQLARAGEAFAAWVSREAFTLVGSATRALLNLLLALVGFYYLLHSADALWVRVRSLLPFSAAGAEVLRARFGVVTEATMLGIVATGLAQGTVVGLGFWAVGLPNPVVWGMVTALASVLPVLGSALVWGPGVVVLLATGRLLAAGALAIIGFVIASNIDNIVRPAVNRRHSGVHPMATLLGAFAGVELLGLVGLLLGPLAISYLFELLRLYEEEYGTAPAATSAADHAVDADRVPPT